MLFHYYFNCHRFVCCSCWSFSGFWSEKTTYQIKVDVTISFPDRHRSELNGWSLLVSPRCDRKDHIYLTEIVRSSIFSRSQLQVRLRQSCKRGLFHWQTHSLFNSSLYKERILICGKQSFPSNPLIQENTKAQLLAMKFNRMLRIQISKRIGSWFWTSIPKYTFDRS